MGHVLQSLGQFGAALKNYATGCLIEQHQLMHCIVQQLLAYLDRPTAACLVNKDSKSTLTDSETDPNSLNNDPTTPAVCRFLSDMNALSPIFGLQAYRLVLELIYRGLLSEYATIANTDPTHLGKELKLGSFRTFSGAHVTHGKPAAVHNS